MPHIMQQTRAMTGRKEMIGKCSQVGMVVKGFSVQAAERGVSMCVL
jgi:hypothetical protein